MSCFNTSYVSVQAIKTKLSIEVLFVSIHPMCRFKKPTTLASTSFTPVSIHPMCRFKHKKLSVTFSVKYVSIHPMCRFKNSYRNIFTLFSKVSIHPMCRFKCCYYSEPECPPVFQYILCVGSSFKMLYSSSVSLTFQYILCVGSSYIKNITLIATRVSIHPMCRFKPKKSTTNNNI